MTETKTRKTLMEILAEVSQEELQALEAEMAKINAKHGAVLGVAHDYQRRLVCLSVRAKTEADKIEAEIVEAAKAHKKAHERTTHSEDECKSFLDQVDVQSHQVNKLRCLAEEYDSVLWGSIRAEFFDEIKSEEELGITSGWQIVKMKPSSTLSAETAIRNIREFFGLRGGVFD